jgi:hypothetical protein
MPAIRNAAMYSHRRIFASEEVGALPDGSDLLNNFPATSGGHPDGELPGAPLHRRHSWSTSMRNSTPRRSGFGTPIAILLMGVTLLSINLWPSYSVFGVGGLAYTEYEWWHCGWPAAYLTASTFRHWTDPYTRPSRRRIDEFGFSGFGLCLNACVAFSLCALISSVGSFIVRRQVTLREVGFITLCLALLCTAFAHLSRAGLRAEPPWERESEREATESEGEWAGSVGSGVQTLPS